ncbi:MAG: DUF4139 domain-containing protein [Phycisphaerae bacterium]|nr:DUF4139 domain-containing protein [Phycisphaerae bacterium]
MNHFNQDILIQYAFGLLEANAGLAVRQHLDKCPECRQHLSELKRKFSVMSVLEGDVELPDDLVSKTLMSKMAGEKTGAFYRKVWIGWAAAAALVVTALWIFLPDSQNKIGAADRFGPKKREQFKDSRDYLSDTKFIQDGAQPVQNSVKIVSSDSIPDSPPFAPASAIELVVLPAPDTMQVTIYNTADLTLVRDIRRLTLKPGWNWLQFMWAETLIDPTSLSLQPLEYADKIDTQQLVYPARLKDIGRWLIRSEVEGAVSFEITYFVSGLSWRAFYEGTLNEDETTLDLKGFVNVANSSGQDFQNAQTRLVVGQTRLTETINYLAGRYYPYGPDVPQQDEKDALKKVPLLADFAQTGMLFSDTSGRFGGGAFKYEIKDIQKEALSEYYLYTIEGTEDLPNAWAKRLESLDASGIPVKSLYKYDEDRYGTDTIRFISFKNDAAHKLGNTPLPEGNVRLYRRLNEKKNLSYIGSAEVKYIPVNEDAELNLGAALLVKVEPIQTDSRTDNYTFNNNGDIDGWDEIESWQLKLTNTRQIPAEIEITRNFGTDYWELKINDYWESGINANGNSTPHAAYTKHDKSHARFTLVLAPRSEKTFGYTVTKYQQRRSEYYVEKMTAQSKEQEK